MIPLLFTIILTIILGIFVNDPMAKGMSIFLSLTLGLIMSNKLLFDLRPTTAYTHKIIVNYSQVTKTKTKLILVYKDFITNRTLKETFDLQNVVFVNSNKGVNKSGLVTIDIPYENKALPNNLQLWFTLPNLWIHTFNRSVYKPYLGKIKVYSKYITNI